MNCPYCKETLPEGTHFCTQCGRYIPETAVAASSREAACLSDEKPPKESRWASISTWGWIGIKLLLLIPIANLVLVLVWSFGGARKQVKRNYARATLILGLISAIISAASIIFLFSHGQSLASFITEKLFF